MSKAHYEVYMKEGCPYSAAAKELLEKRHLPAETYVVPASQLEQVKQAHHMQTFPQVFYVDTQSAAAPKKLIGGYDDLVNHLASRSARNNKG